MNPTNHTILVIDDNLNNLKVVATYLSQQGFNVLTAGNGKLGLKRAELGLPDLILLDVVMPDIDGFETCNLLKTNLATKEIPIIFMTGLTETEYKVKGFTAGAVDYVTKPFQQEEVLARVTAHLKIRNLTQELQNTNQDLVVRTEELLGTLSDLQMAQKKLIEAEKMVALGNLVTGVAHEVSTPIGVSLMAASILDDKTVDMVNCFNEGELKLSDLKHYLSTTLESSHLLLDNLQQAAELLRNFKQVAVDQANFERRVFKVKPYINGILISLSPKLKQTNHVVSIYGDEKISIESYPGAFAQIITNLVMNSLNHAYQENEFGQLTFVLTPLDNQLLITYNDDGCGISPEDLKRIFEPFFTTARHAGGTGLGLYIVYNLVTQKLGGQIQAESNMGVGTTFRLKLPF
jgi:signal transduction histidine kinase